MADDANRAAKAARAKAMLKKRQQQQKAIGSDITPSASPAPVESQGSILSPHGEAERGQHRDVASLFGDSAGNPVTLEEFGVISPSPVRAGRHAAGHMSPPPPPISQPDEELKALVKNQQQTISLLVAEKASLVDQLGSYAGMKTKLSRLEVESEKIRKVAETVPVLQHELNDMKRHLEEVEENERVANDKARDMEHALSDARLVVSETTRKLTEALRELNELKEDDRGEILERTLEASRGRVEELENRVGRLVQTLDATTNERDMFKTDLGKLQEQFNAQSSELSTLTLELSTIQSSYSTLQATFQSSEVARASLEDSLTTSQMSITSLQQELASMTSDLATHSRHLHVARAEAEDAKRRAEDSEAIVRSLQSENKALMDQVEEMQPRLVELTNKRIEEAERAETAQRRVVKAEKEVERLEGIMEELKAAKEQVEEAILKEREDWAHVEQRCRGAVDDARAELEETQAAHATLSKELDNLRQKLMRAEFENASQRGTISTARQEVAMWQSEAESRLNEMDVTKREMDEMRNKEEEMMAVLERAQADVEALRDQLALREDELARLRGEEEEDRSTASGSRPASKSRHHPRHSLDEEIAQTVDLSNAHSRIRALEQALHDAERSAERRIQTLETELTQARMRRMPSPSLAFPPRKSAFHMPDEAIPSRRHSLNTSRPHTPSSLRTSTVHVQPRAVYDANLSADMRHKRKVSLGMLKARIESERASGIGLGSPRLSLSRLPTTAELDEERSTAEGRNEGKSRIQTAQIVDESHVFWCHSCSGDLVVL